MALFSAIVSRSSRFRDLFFAMARICQSGCAALVEVARRVFWRCAAFSQLVGSRVAHCVCSLRGCVLCVPSSLAAFVVCVVTRLRVSFKRCCTALLQKVIVLFVSWICISPSYAALCRCLRVGWVCRVAHVSWPVCVLGFGVCCGCVLRLRVLFDACWLFFNLSAAFSKCCVASLL